MGNTVKNASGLGLSESVHCYLDGARGIYIPRDFARGTKREAISGVKAEDLDYLARGPGGVLDVDQTLAEGETERGEFYWETWETVLDNAIVTDPLTERKFHLYQDCDLFLVPENLEFNEDTEQFEPPESDTLMRFELYSCWASYLVNGDPSGLEDCEQKQVDEFLAKEGLEDWTCTDASERTHFGTPDSGGLKGEIARYTFIKIG